MSDSQNPVEPGASAHAPTQGQPVQSGDGPATHQQDPGWTAPESWAPPSTSAQTAPPIAQQYPDPSGGQQYPGPPSWQQYQGQSGWQQYQGQPGWQYSGQPGWQQPATGAPSWQQSWTPPPKPGLFPLRPMTFGRLFGTPFAVLRHNPRATVGGALIVQLITTVTTVVVVGATTAFAVLRIGTASQEQSSDQQLIAAGSVALLIAAVLVGVVISLVGTAMVQGLVATEVARGALGEKLTLRGLWRWTRGRRWRLIGWTALLAAAVVASVLVPLGVGILTSMAGSTLATVLAVVFAVLCLIAVWIWVGTKTALTPSVIVVEKAGVFHAVGRSWHLTRRSFWRTFGTLVLVWLVCSVASSIVTVPLQAIYAIVISVISPTGSLQSGNAITVTIVYYVLSLVVGTFIGSITSVVESATATTIYLDLRMRREGLDADLRRVVDERAAGIPDAGDPFATPAWIAQRAWGVPPAAGAPDAQNAPWTQSSP
ncbi:hypothetical protein HII28_14635 [Planctomonas sp. JC2975]|uniref:hypothetical protein n=1 Tax=Planctomonas sp. JC2975 TaxID=2729626 RepID=UPI0014732C77|nr:hypothetical protein [Planctomonas sp. JC2975]NNC13109.1 hypothetical protein [Planctomonas sp. JC2975]